MSIQLFPRANEGRELLIQIKAKCDENAIQNPKGHELRKVFEDFQQTFNRFAVRIKVGGAINHGAENDVKQKKIAQDFSKENISELANSIATIEDPQHKKNAVIIEECLRKIVFKASGAKSAEEFENIQADAYCKAANVLNAKMEKLLAGKLKTQAQKEEPES